MPELPEAEINRRRVEAHCLDRTAEAVVLGENTEHVELPGGNERARLEGRQFTETHRHGKLIFAGNRTGPWIAVHLGMTGSLRPYEADEGVPDYTKLILQFEGDRRLAFRNPRKLGWVRVIDSPEALVAEEGLGPDALSVSRETFREAVGGTRGAVKSALMAQRKLAGLGNLWSDEMLFHTGVAPGVHGTTLSRERLDALYDVMHEILDTVVGTDTDYSKLPDHWLNPHRKTGATCPRCGDTIRKEKVGGRTAYFCSGHQEG